MKKNLLIRALGLLLAVAVLCSVGISALAADEEPAPLGGDVAGNTEAWTNDALSTAEMKQLLNGLTLYPQRTGWDKLDQRLESMLSEGETTYDKLWNFYTWLVENVTYSWEGYTVTEGSLAAYESVTGYDYLSPMTYETGLQKSIPDDMANRTYHILTRKMGISYDHAIAFAVAARYLGIESYVRTGRFVVEDTNYDTPGHHGWAVLVLGGKQYVFDPQRDQVNYKRYRRNGYYFGVPIEKATRFQPDYWSSDTLANKARDASMLPVDAERSFLASLKAVVEGNGFVEGTGDFQTGGDVTLTAHPGDGATFVGWYDRNGTSLGSELTLTFRFRGNTTITAKFTSDYAVVVSTVGSGTVEGAGAYASGSTVELRATAGAGSTFVGWYGEDGTLLSSDPVYRFTLAGKTVVTAKFAAAVTVTAQASRSGSVQGGGSFPYGTEVTLTAVPGSAAFQGWYNTDGALISESAAYTFTANSDVTCYALFQGDVFVDIPAGAWYESTAMEAVSRGLLSGITPVTFGPDKAFTRAMAAVMLARIEGAPTAGPAETPFTDVPRDAWFAGAVKWAFDNGVINGRSAESFAPNDDVSRQEFFTMAARYLGAKGYTVTAAELPFSDRDAIADWAKDAVAQLYTMGIVAGDPGGTVRPASSLTRAEGTAIIVRITKYMEEHTSSLSPTDAEIQARLSAARKVGVIPAGAAEGFASYFLSHKSFWDSVQSAEWDLLGAADGTCYLRCYFPLNSAGTGNLEALIWKEGAVTAAEPGTWTQESRTAFENEITGGGL